MFTHLDEIQAVPLKRVFLKNYCECDVHWFTIEQKAHLLFNNPCSSVF